MHLELSFRDPYEYEFVCDDRLPEILIDREQHDRNSLEKATLAGIPILHHDIQFRRAVPADSGARDLAFMLCSARRDARVGIDGETMLPHVSSWQRVFMWTEIAEDLAG